MTIQSSILVAGSGLRSVTQALGVVSQNVANAATPSYAREAVAPSSVNAGVGGGVSAGPASRDVNLALEAGVFAQNADVAARQTLSTALAQIDATQGTTAAGNDLSSQVGALVDSFTTLSADPSNQAGQSAVVLAAKTLAGGINALADAFQAGRQTAQDALSGAVTKLNQSLQTVGTLSKQIVQAQALGQSTADLENQRDVAESTAAQLAGIRFLTQPDGGVVALAGGSQVDLTASTAPFAIQATALTASSAGSALTLSGQDVTDAITTGSIGANLALRDTILPAGQAGIDEFAKTLANRLADQGLQLFTDSSGGVPAGGGTPAQTGYVGFANVVQVNPAVLASPSLVRDGTNAVAPGTGGAAGFTPNPAGGPAGFTTLISAVINYGFGSQSQAGVVQALPAWSGLGVNGDVTLSYTPATNIQGYAANLVAAQSNAVSAADTAVSTSTALQATLQSKLQAGAGVSIDSELSNLIVLQNAYGANAKVLTAAQSLWSVLFSAVSGQL